ncbi:clathrin coat assembly protein AP180-like isoform X5 [Tachysurus fulvidraco]|uniref:clathrin coat assembly protein AP180-like isoform X5 n=1 Tax=Tachysurus fulvidraco TaxID=1234273 RepID=UPI001FEEC434|nr:clathrin coat assembly protein AP180-like isoform X5 [Tachysurus fulvidraco]
MSGQTLTDRIAAAQYQLTGSDVARAVCKATTHEVMAPKKKHLEYLIAATNETNVNIPQMADTLFERAMNASWVVVFKALVTTHHMCIHGNERFIQYLASRNSLFNLSNFIDKTGTHGYDMSTFIRRYARYLNEKAYAYRAMAFDFTRVKKGADGVMRTMAPEKLLKAMPALQTQVDTLLEFDVHPKDLNNGIINGAFMLLFKDLIKLFASYNDGIINLLEKYFKMKKSDCKESLEIYKKFLTRVTKISEFMKIAEQVGVDKNDIPDISYAPSSILESLETHMNSLEGKKGEGSPTKGSPTNNVSPTSTPSKSGASVPTLEPPPTEAAAASASASAASAPAEPATDSLLDLDPLSSSGPPASSAPTSWGDLLGSEFGSLTTETLLPDSTPAVDSTSPATAVSSAPTGEGAASVAPPSTTAGPTPSSADLLGDAFGSSAAEPAPAVETGGSSTVTAPAADASAANDSAGAANGQATAPAPATSAGGDLMGAFGGLGDMLMPAMAPQPAAAAAMAASPVKPAGGDLDSTMASLAGNLGMGTQKPGEAAGGANWQAQHGATGAAPMMFPQQPMMRPQFPSAGAPAAPMSSGMTQSPRKPPPPKDPLADLNIKDFL